MAQTNGKEIIKAIIKDRGMTQGMLASKMGYASQSGVGQRLSVKGELQLDIFASFLEAMDYEVIVKSKTKTGDTYKVTLLEETK